MRPHSKARHDTWKGISGVEAQQTTPVRRPDYWSVMFSEQDLHQKEGNTNIYDRDLNLEGSPEGLCRSSRSHVNTRAPGWGRPALNCSLLLHGLPAASYEACATAALLDGQEYIPFGDGIPSFVYS